MSRITNAAEHVIRKCGNGNFAKGLELVARATGVNPIQIRRWTYPRERGGCGGVIPARHHPKILAEARRARRALQYEDFFNSAKAAS